MHKPLFKNTRRFAVATQFAVATCPRKPRRRRRYCCFCCYLQIRARLADESPKTSVRARPASEKIASQLLCANKTAFTAAAAAVNTKALRVLEHSGKKAHHTTNHDDTTTRRRRTNLKAETRRNINLVSGCRRHRHPGPYRFKQALHEKNQNETCNKACATDGEMHNTPGATALTQTRRRQSPDSLFPPRSPFFTHASR